MSANISGSPRVQSSPTKKRTANKQDKSVLVTLFFYTLFVLFVFGVVFNLWFFLTESGSNLRFMMADSLITTQHRDWAKYLIGSEELKKRVDRYVAQFEQYSDVKDQVRIDYKAIKSTDKTKPPIEIEPIQGANFKGYLLIVHDPKMLRIAVPGRVGKGEKVSSMVDRLGAAAGVNAGGFVDPEWMGNGFQPTGLVMSGGKIFYNDGGLSTPNHIVGIDKDGKLVAGKFSPNELLKMGVQEAVTFSPKFIVNGVGQIKSQTDGWGIAPRTCMAQKEDGSIMFAIIDGRQPGHSIGATLYDVQTIFLKHGAVTAANLDGGSSTVLVKDHKIINKPSSEYGERYLPTAWLVFTEPEKANIKNIWEGLDPSKIDPSKW